MHTCTLHTSAQSPLETKSESNIAMPENALSNISLLTFLVVVLFTQKKIEQENVHSIQADEIHEQGK